MHSPRHLASPYLSKTPTVSTTRFQERSGIKKVQPPVSVFVSRGSAMRSLKSIREASAALTVPTPVTHWAQNSELSHTPSASPAQTWRKPLLMRSLRRRPRTCQGRNATRRSLPLAPPQIQPLTAWGKTWAPLTDTYQGRLGYPDQPVTTPVTFVARASVRPWCAPLSQMLSPSQLTDSVHLSSNHRQRQRTMLKMALMRITARFAVTPDTQNSAPTERHSLTITGT